MDVLSIQSTPPPMDHMVAALSGSPGCTGRVELRLLGGFDLRLDGASQGLQRAGQRLLAFVALAPRGVTRMFTAFQLWPDTEERRALANLRSTLWRVNQLAVDVIVDTGSRLRVADQVWVDVRDGLEELQGGAAIDGGLLPFHSAVPDLLPDWYEDWLIVERERYRQWSLQLLERRAECALDAGRTSEALQLALAATAIDPTRACAHALVVAAHRRDGNELDARRETARYRRCVEWMLAPVAEGSSIGDG